MSKASADVQGMKDHFNTEFVRVFERIQRGVHQNALAHGWWDEPREGGTLIALIMSEAAEALEALRKGNGPDEHCPEPDVHIANPMYEPRLSYVYCDACGMRGPLYSSEQSAISAWNTLPRALRWTHEPPKVAGWYWHHMPPAFGTVIEFFDPEISKADCGEWAGPIAPPID